MMGFDPNRCANCGGGLQPGYLIVDQGNLTWHLCGWKCARELAEHPDAQRATDTARGALYRAWVRGPMRWQVYRTASGALLRKMIEYQIPFRSVSAAVSAARADAGPDAVEISTRAR